MTGCAGLLPEIKKTTKSPWKTFGEAKKSFDLIVPEKTTKEELKLLGFDPFETPNVKLITYLDVLERFVPNQAVQLQHLHPQIRACLEAKGACHGYEVKPSNLQSKRYGNAVLDLLNFRRKTITSGWRFDAIIVLNEEVVIYKLWGGEPNVLEFEDKKNPLGPLQDIGRVFKIENF
ncbi:hypothetical protein [Candidatus Albibeggiatoa sp. nov. BB20]|uniref:hypothetical protein n=1 Tax=Candidatus Albibeggiatoa sp. nov. BB20 TaxID=3162723 RepID=UPI0033655916